MERIPSRNDNFWAAKYKDGWSIFACEGKGHIAHGLNMKQAVNLMDELDPAIEQPKPKPILHFEKNNSGRIYIAITEFEPHHHTQVLSSQDTKGMPVQSVMQHRFDTLTRVIDCEVDDQINQEDKDG